MVPIPEAMAYASSWRLLQPQRLRQQWSRGVAPAMRSAEFKYLELLLPGQRLPFRR
ncbi:hypothetical protein ACF2JD_13895 [Aeromonas sp. A-5]|uniref:hypothetical protein n=1 Tax=Aeromonas ichthyocola TaxID=3367746 RepID=UPI0038EAF6CE